MYVIFETAIRPHCNHAVLIYKGLLPQYCAQAILVGVKAHGLCATRKTIQQRGCISLKAHGVSKYTTQLLQIYENISNPIKQFRYINVSLRFRFLFTVKILKFTFFFLISILYFTQLVHKLSCGTMTNT
jgi:hypothetical protein